MDTPGKITGTWCGTYSQRLPELARVSFKLILKESEFGQFTGAVIDESAGGMPGVGTIEGHFKFPHIVFVKRMPVSYVVSTDGRHLRLREYLAECGHACDRDLPHPPIFYRGEFADPTFAHGTWLIRPERLALDDGTALDMPTAEGDWNFEACTDRAD